MVNSKLLFKVSAIVLLALLLTSGLWLWSGIHNAYDSVTTTIEDESLSAPVKVYRDERGTPTIIGNALPDVVFAQGYEHARDRLWQLEFTRSVANAELSRLFGSDLLESDIFLKTLDLKRNAEHALQQSSPEIKQLLTQYVAGVNRYISDHRGNLPLEFQLLNVQPKLWTLLDIFGVQGMMSYDLAWSGVDKELNFLKVYQQIGMNKTLQIMPIETPFVKAYLQSYNESMEGLSTSFHDYPRDILGPIGLAYGIGSNNWVVSGNKTDSGNPIVANDPHLGLTTPGIWWKVHLIVTDGSYHVEGFALPGAPLVIVGHNQQVAWGVTNTGTDAVDLFYFKSNDTHYLVGNTWKKFQIITKTIEIKGTDDYTLTYKLSDFGPIMDFDGTEYAVKWVLQEGLERDKLIRAVYDLNIATSVDDIHEALINWAVPGQNIVFADIQGNIGYQYTGAVPIRKNGYGILPHNASTGMYDWQGVENYSKQLYIKNPSKGYFATANERIDTTNTMYINEFYAVGYRGRRINTVLDNGTNFKYSDGSSFSIDDIKQLQNDVYDSSVEDFLSPRLSALQSGTYTADLAQQAVQQLSTFDGYTTTASIAATIYSTYRMFFIYNTIVDELGSSLAVNNEYLAHIRIGEWSVADPTNAWFDNVNTTKVETADDIAVSSLDQAVNYLTTHYGSDMSQWNWGNIHRVSFAHVMGEVVPFLNNGPEPNGGTTFTVDVGGAPNMNKDGSLAYDQGHGASMRFIAEIESTWSHVYGVVTPGESGYMLSDNYGDGFPMWLNSEYTQWQFQQTTIVSRYKISAEYRRT